MKNFLQAALLFAAILIVGCSKETPAEPPPIKERWVDTAAYDGSDLVFIPSVWVMRTLNEVRENPAGYSSKIGIDLRGVPAMPRLVWSDTLYKIARRKAIDMATRDYLDHKTPEGLGIDKQIIDAGFELDAENYFITSSSSNYESLEKKPYTAEAESGVVYDMIYDGGVDGSDARRKHLLGIGGRSTLNTIGVGLVAVQELWGEDVYVCVIIAKKKK